MKATKTQKKIWKDNPSKNAPYIEKKNNLTQEEIRLLFELKESKERGAASLGCSNHRAISIATLEKLGFAKQHGFGPTSFYITDAGLKESTRHKQPEKKPPPPLVEAVKPIQYGYAKVPKTPKERVVKVDPNLSPIATECGTKSTNRVAALDFLYKFIGKMQTVAAVMKAIYGDKGATEGATDIVIKSLQRDLGNSKAKDKYEVKRVKDAKGVYSYGFYKK